ncbi:unnamed protein product, partial [Musa banksii]
SLEPARRPRSPTCLLSASSSLRGRYWRRGIQGWGKTTRWRRWSLLKLGLRCSHPLPTARPSMRQVVRYLEGHAPLAELSPTYLSFSAFVQVHNEGADDHITSYTSSVASASEEYEPLVSNNKSCPCVTLLVKEETHGMILVQPVNFACVRLMTPKPTSLFALLCSLKIYHSLECNRALVCLLLFLLLHRRSSLAASSNGSDDGDDFIFNGFGGANLTLDGVASITSTGLLMVTDASMETKGHAFHPSPLRFRDLSNGTVISFSTTFAFGFISDYPGLSGHGMAFVISHTKDFSKALGSQFLGLFNQSSKANSSSNHVLAIELDTILSPDFQDIDNNHVGIDINTLISNKSHTAGYYDDHTGSFERLSLKSGQAMQVWIDYHARDMLLNVTLAPIPMAKPHRPLLSAVIDLKSVLLDLMYVGFSSSTGPWLTSHYVLGWSFKMNGVLRIRLPLASATLLEYGPHRFSYKDLFKAAKGFRDTELLGRGGFGRVYKGVLQSSRSEVAIKRVSHGSRQGMREFIAEIVSLGRLRHRNLFLHDQAKPTLDWATRFRIIKGVASGLLYLHEDWEQVVIHRDIKASNVLLDNELNGRLGDFGLARLYDHGTDPQTTHVVGTMGYLAPELARTGKATTITDVFAFGAFLLEVACGRRPVDPTAHEEQLVLQDWVLGLLCSHPLPTARPSMRQVVRYLEGHAPLPELSPANLSFSLLALLHKEGFDDHIMSCPSSSVATASVLSGGR